MGRISRKYHWSGMKKYIEDYIKKCEECQKLKKSPITKMPLVMPNVSQYPFDRIYIDLVTDLPKTISGNIHILSMMDDLSRFVDFVAIPNQEANTVAEALFEQIISRYTLPKEILSDQGANFCGKVMKELCKLLKIKKL